MDGRRPPSDDGARGEALELLRELAAWRLQRSSWPAVRSAVTALREATSAQDGDAFRRALSELELAGPDTVRGVAIGSPPTVPPPETILAEVYELIHRVDDPPRER